ncbi:MAG: hypothetical protein E6K18_06215 [Methanobacteriota archaeon]|nr:MAG: hypothetical protein E6K18_06215 [Euryarchaeota archaeon]
MAAVRLAPPVPGLWANADLVKVTAYSDLSRLVTKITTNYQVNYSYALKAYDWTIDWNHWFGFGPYPWPAVFTDELNTVSQSVLDSNVLEVRVASPSRTLHEGLVISLEDSGTPTYIDGLQWTFVVEFYQRVPWPWITFSETAPIISGLGSHTVDATVAIPANAGIGSYEAAIVVRDTTHGTTTTVPVMVNVAARGPSLSFGGNPLSTDLYDNNRLFGGYDRGLATATRLAHPLLGDWRYYFFEIPDQGLYGDPVGYKILVQTNWPAAPSDVDTYAFGRTPGDIASQSNATYYGSFTLKQVLKGDELDKPDFKTATAGPQEYAAYDLASGLNVIGLRAFSMRGQETDVRISGRAGWVNAPPSVDVATQNLAGRAPFAFLSNMDLPGLRASAVGPAQTTAFSSVDVHQDVQSWWNFPDFNEWLSRASFNYTFHVEKALILDVHIEGQSDVNDLDLGLFRNTFQNPAGAPCEWDPALKDPLTGIDGYWKGCVVDPEEWKLHDCAQITPSRCWPVGPATGGEDADGDADEEIKWVNPPDGEYMIKVLGFAVPGRTGHFDLQIGVTLDTGKGYEVPEAPKPAEIVNGTGGGVAAFTRVAMNMTWDFPPAQADDKYGGAVLLGLPNAPGVVVVPASVTLDRTPPQITSIQLQASHGRIDRATNRTVSDRSPTIIVSVADPQWGQLNPLSARISVDGMDLTPFATVSIQYITRANKLALWEGTISAPTQVLSDSPPMHTAQASIADAAGNVGNGTFAFSVDTQAPALVVNGPPRQFTTVNSFTISGTTGEGSASVNIRGVWHPVNPDGTFSFPVPLLDGTNALAVTAADWFDADASGNPIPGNAVTITQTVIRDTIAPVFDVFVADPSGVIRDNATVVSGTAHDLVSDTEQGSSADLQLTVNGNVVPIFADGSYYVVVPLAEGPNSIDAVLTDGAGNQATASTSVTRDTTKPVLVLTTKPGATVATPIVTLAGTTEPGAFVTVNGVFVLSTVGTFTTNVTLSPGANTIVVQSRDFAGNLAEERLSVTYTPAGGSLILPIGMGIGGVALGALLAVVLVRRGVRIPGLSRGPAKSSGGDSEGSTSEPGTAAEPDAAADDPREARLRQALADGRITQEVYDQNLRRIRGNT